MNKWMRSLVLLVLCGFLCGCGAKPLEKTDAALLIDADTRALEGDESTYALYFRLSDGPYLAAETRNVEVGRDETVEMALIRQLIAGPSVTQAVLQPLFPSGTQVMATSKQGDLLFVTFSEDFLSGYNSEKSDLPAAEKKMAVQQERQLCLDALAATLTDAGLCTRVQVLVHRRQVKTSSLRLEEDYLYQNGSALPLPEITRQEDTLFTPYNAARHVLDAWMTRNHDQLLSSLAVQGRPTVQIMESLMENSLTLTGFRLSHGDVSADGQWAVVTAELTLHREGQDQVRSGYPIRMRRENGVWKMPFDTLQSMMTEE